MTAIGHQGGPDLRRLINWETEPNNNASFHWGDKTTVIKQASLGVPSHVSTAAPTTPRRISSFRVEPDQSHHAIDQNAETSKKVHFHDRLEQTHVFSPSDSPLSLNSKLCSFTSPAVNAEPKSYNTFQLSRNERICILNSASSPPSPWQPVRLQNLELLPSSYKIRGSVTVFNLAFQKRVSVRFTFDDWKTVSDVAANHSHSLYLNHTIVSDLFSFVIYLKRPPLDTGGRLQMCASYHVLNEEFWDNNNGKNYVIVLRSVLG